MLTTITGFFGIVLGLLISEYFRRTTRIETYSKEIFQKRLNIYEVLFYKINKARDIANDIITNSEYSKDHRHAIWSNVVLDIAKYLDEHALYLNDEITVHCLMTVIGIDEIYDIENSTKKKIRSKNLEIIVRVYFQ